MPQFLYKAKKPNAETVAGELDAEHKEDAIERLNQMGLLPVSVEEKGAKAHQTAELKYGRVKVRELYMFSRQLVNLLKSGIPILRALEILSIQTKNKLFKRVIEEVRTGVKNGKPFSDCLATYPNIFPTLYVTMVRAGEESGQIRETITDIAAYLRMQDEVASKVRSALAYPIFMAIFGVGTIIFILTYVMPQITDLFVSLKQDLPVPTLIVMRASDILLHWWPWLLCGAFFLWVSFVNWTKTKAGRRSMSQLSISLPFFGDFFLKVELARYCRTLALLIKSGISIVQAIKIAVPVMGNELIQQQLKKSHEDLIAGKSFAQSMREMKIIPAMIGDLISVGEESGLLVVTLNDISDMFEQETAEKIKIMTTLLEPLMILAVGAVVGFIVVAMLLPIFQLDVFAG